jgi:hypothetical protein
MSLRTYLLTDARGGQSGHFLEVCPPCPPYLATQAGQRRTMSDMSAMSATANLHSPTQQNQEF